MRKATGSYCAYSSLVKLLPWFLTMWWKICLWAEQPRCRVCSERSALQQNTLMSTAVGQAAACAPVTQRPRFDSRSEQVSWVRFFRDFFSPVREMSESFRPPRYPYTFGRHYHRHSPFITGANDLRCLRALKP